jgi:hypothetical protein
MPELLFQYLAEQGRALDEIPQQHCAAAARGQRIAIGTERQGSDKSLRRHEHLRDFASA